MSVTDDRATKQQTHNHFSDSGLGDDLRDFLGNPAPAQPRTRNLRPTFRAVPAEQSGDPGFPGTRAFSQPAYRSDSGAAGSVGQPAGAGADGAPAPVARADDVAGRRPSFPKAIQHTIANRSALPANPSPAGGRVRRRPGRQPGSGKKAKLAQANSPGSAAQVMPAAMSAVSQIVRDNVPSSAPKYTPTESERADARRLFRA